MLGYLLAAFFGLLGAAMVLGSLTFITENVGGALFFIVIGVLLIGAANYFYQAQKGNVDHQVGYTLK